MASQGIQQKNFVVGGFRYDYKVYLYISTSVLNYLSQLNFRSGAHPLKKFYILQCLKEKD